VTSEGHSVHRAAAEGFALGADTYARGRPGFPAAVQTWLRDELRLQPGRTVLDLGAGTGKFTVELLAAGAKVFAVEPVAAMLDNLRVSAPGATALAGDAESIPLADETCDAIVCAQSFHWFATHAALAGIRRVWRQDNGARSFLRPDSVRCAIGAWRTDTRGRRSE
jgi:ubiquinone/menaquinone biosynthesis C-methylase UbiE